MITLITPTGDRPEAFRLCERWMVRQTYRGSLQWIVVDDGRTPTRPTMVQQYIRREPSRRDPSHTLAINLATALPHVRGEKILIIEDDDYYAADYIRTMADWLDQADLAGEVGARYFHLPERRWRHWTEHDHASLCRTGFTRRVIPTLEAVLRSQATTGDWRIDLALWERWAGSKHRERPGDRGRALCVGMKGLPGRKGITHRLSADTRHDPRLSKLSEWIGPGLDHYLPLIDFGRVVVYTALFGGYDRLAPPPDERGVRFVCFTDDPSSAPKGWDAIHVEPTEADPRRENRKWKILGHRWFPRADWTIYQDACLAWKRKPSELIAGCESLKPDGNLYCFRHYLRDCLYAEADVVVKAGFDKRGTVEAQVRRYAALCMPRGAGLAWCGLMVRRAGCESHGERWWTEVCGGSARDQISFPIACRETGTPWTAIPGQIPYGGGVSEWFSRTDHLKSRRT